MVVAVARRRMLAYIVAVVFCLILVLRPHIDSPTMLGYWGNCVDNNSAPVASMVQTMTLCNSTWQSFDLVFHPDHREKLVVYSASITSPARSTSQGALLRKGEALLRITAIIYNPKEPHFTKGNDHLAISNRAEEFVRGLRCISNGGLSSSVFVRYHGHDRVDQAPQELRHLDDVLMTLECGVVTRQGISDNSVVYRLEYNPVGTPYRPVQTFDLEICKIKMPRHQVSMCTNAVYTWSSAVILEWIRYHRRLGVEHIYVYDRYDEYIQTLAPLVLEGFVTRYSWPLHCSRDDCNSKQGEYFDQWGLLSHCLERHRQSTTWISPLDIDEIWHLPSGTQKSYHANIRQVLNARWCEHDYGEQRAQSITYFTQQEEKALLNARIAAFTDRDPNPAAGASTKYFAHTGMVDTMGVHEVQTFFAPRPSQSRFSHSHRTYNFDESFIRVNHMRKGGFKKADKNVLQHFLTKLAGPPLVDNEHLWALE